MGDLGRLNQQVGGQKRTQSGIGICEARLGHSLSARNRPEAIRGSRTAPRGACVSKAEFGVFKQAAKGDPKIKVIAVAWIARRPSTGSAGALERYLTSYMERVGHP